MTLYWLSNSRFFHSVAVMRALRADFGLRSAAEHCRRTRLWGRRVRVCYTRVKAPRRTLSGPLRKSPRLLVPTATTSETRARGGRGSVPAHDQERREAA